VAILLTAEGSTLLVIWNEIAQDIDWMTNNLWDPAYFNSSHAYASSLLTNLTNFENSFKQKYLLDAYNYTAGAANFSHLDFATTEGMNKAEDLYNEMVTSVAVFLFDNFDVELPSDDSTGGSELNKLEALASVFWTVFLYYIIAGGCLLIVLGVMYWFGKTNKSRWEYGSIAVRIAVGLGLALVSISYLFNTSFNLFFSPWMIPMVVIIYFIGKAPFPFDLKPH
jgi:ABC-type sugar transport system permease subunit